MKYKYLVCTLIILAICLLWANPSPAQKPIKFRYFTGMTSSHYFSADLLPFFAKEVKKRTYGKAKVEVYPGGQLFGYRDGIDAAIMGAVEMGLVALGHWGGHNPVFQFSDYFMLFDDIEHWGRARDTVDSILAPLFQKKNVKILYYSAYGENGICGKAAIENLEDIKGLKIRAPVPGALACLATWGATPTKIAAAEVYDAIAKGAIDGCVTSWSSMYARKFYEVTNHFVGPIMRSVWVNFINLNTWKSLPADIQKIIMEVSRDTEERSITIMKAFDVKSLNKLKEVGTVKILTPAEKISWATPLKSTYDAWVKKCDDKGYGNEARRILEAIEKAR